MLNHTGSQLLLQEEFLMESCRGDQSACHFFVRWLTLSFQQSFFFKRPSTLWRGRMTQDSFSSVTPHRLWRCICPFLSVTHKSWVKGGRSNLMTQGTRESCKPVNVEPLANIHFSPVEEKKIKQKKEAEMLFIYKPVAYFCKWQLPSVWDSLSANLAILKYELSCEMIALSSPLPSLITLFSIPSESSRCEGSL